MKAAEAGMNSVVVVVGLLAEEGDEMVADLGDSPVAAFAFCLVNIGIWHTVVMTSPMTLPWPPLLRLR